MSDSRSGMHRALTLAAVKIAQPDGAQPPMGDCRGERALFSPCLVEKDRERV